ncbi:MAG: Gfo/Idh/MocA family oxidoreductase [Patescibacteria group bacterium]
MEQKRLKTAIIGVGRWGKNVAKELAHQSTLVAYASSGTGQDEAWMAEVMPHAKRLTVDEICAQGDIQAVAVATPIATHAGIVRMLLSAGKHVLCEKPLAEDPKTAYELAALAAKNTLGLMTGYVYLYHPAYQKMKEELAGKKISRVDFYWKKYGSFFETIEMNLLTHHFALLLDLVGMPTGISVTRREKGESACDILDTTILYPSCEVSSHIDRMSKERIHTMTVRADGEEFIWEGAQLRDEHGIFESRDTPLAVEVEAFLNMAQGKGKTLTAGDFGAKVLEIHEKLG